MYPVTLSDYIQIGKDYKAQGQKQSLWEQFLTGTQTTFQQQAQQVQDVYSYDISQAYANYKKQQLQLQMNEQLGAGFQQQMGSELRTDYGSAYQDIKTQEKSALAKVRETELAAIQEGENRFAKLGKTGQQLDKAIYDFADSDSNLIGLYGGDFSAEKLYGARRDGGLQFYKQSKDAKGNLVTELTEYGKDFYNKVLHGTENRFAEFLQSNEDYAELYDLYMENPDLYNYMLGGLEYGTREYDTSRMTKLLEQEHTDEVNLIGEKSTNENYQKYISGLSSKSTEDLRKLNTTISDNKIAEKFNTIPNYGGHATISNGVATDVVTGETFKRGYIDYDNANRVKIQRSVPNLKEKLQSGELTKGDIIVYDGKKFIISDWRIKYGVLDVAFIYNMEGHAMSKENKKWR